MTHYSDKATLRQLVERVHQRARKVLVEYDRFEWFSSQLRARRHEYTVDQLCHYLYAPPTWPAQRERVLVLLSMHDDREALEVLRTYTVGSQDHALSLFRGFAVQAWEESHPSCSSAHVSPSLLSHHNT